jgi:hypothetical protein
MSRSFFCVELCFSFVDRAALHSELRTLIQVAPRVAAPDEKWRLHRRAVDLLSREVQHAERGCWEYMDDDSDSTMWNDWMRPLRERDRRPKGDEPGGWFTFGMMFQLKRHSATDHVIAALYRSIGDTTWTRNTFAHMLQAIPRISFGSVARDTMYLMPRDDNKGWTDAELGLEHMKYLRVIS